MFHRLGYLFRDTGNNIWRNTTLFLATFIAVWVSLTMFGSAIILRQGVDDATGRWSEDVQFTVFMNADATADQLAEIERSIEANPEIELVSFVDQQESYDLLVEQFGEDSNDLLSVMTPADMPPSYRVRPLTNDADVVSAIASSFRSKPGVRSVADAPELLRSIERNSQRISTFLLIASVVVLVAAIMLIVNTIRTAIFARRDDIEIMKLVGASNWYIRTPFVIEGTIQGLIGAVLAIPMLFLLNNLLKDFVSDESLALLQGLPVEDSFIWNTSMWVMLLGAGIGAIGSLIVVGRYVDV